MTKAQTEKHINEHILEIRYKPNPKILDHRGEWAELLSTHLGLPEWRIDENRIDVYDKETKERVFVGFRNGGFATYLTPTANYFPDKACKFLKYLMDLKDFGDPLFVDRLGVRSKFVTPHPHGFDDLRDRYGTRYLVLAQPAKEAIGGELLDVGGPLDFRDKLGNFKIICGPMPKAQMSQFMSAPGEYPEVGLYFDIDYWVRPGKQQPSREIIECIRSIANEAWKRHERVRDVICGD